VEALKENNKLRDNLLYIFFKLGRDRKNNFLDMMENDMDVNKLKYYMYTFLGKVVPLVLILLAIFVDIRAMLVLLGVTFLNSYINNSERNNIKSNGLFYLRDIIKASKQAESIKDEEVSNYVSKIKDIHKHIKSIDRATALIGFVNMWGGFFESISVIFLLEECAYYAISSVLEEKREYLLELYYLMGEMEALISISGYQYNSKQKFVKPKFTKELLLDIEEGIHPLIDEAVANSVKIENKGIVLTGTNMSGKSTFLRMLGINILLAQTFYFVLAKKYEACFLNIVSSISPNDDLSEGKSYYMAEAEALLRIIKAQEKSIPVFCPIDEIFRGTNPIERISMSAEILTYLNQRKSITIVATHDKELVNLLKDIYEFYYFSESVDSDTGLSFDYKLKKGIIQTRNAIKLLGYLNYPKEIVEGAYKRADQIKGFI
jgi:Mismatch repair ATPase (MutS family)